MSEKGYVYILSNPSMPGLVKIGKTTRDVESRAGELYSSGVPEPFFIEHQAPSPDCNELESWVHEALGEFRVSGSREFFKISVRDATEKVDQSIMDQVTDLVGEYVPGHDVVWGPMVVPEADIVLLADVVGVCPYDVASAMGELTGDEIRAALARWTDKKEKRRIERAGCSI